ncbi:MAG TPA: branched-chain amino acid ABC transporter permease [Propionibacteriaceae bacterium]
MELLQRLTDGLIDGSLIALAAIGISLVFSVQRFANVSQAGLMSAGAYLGFVGTSFGLTLGFVFLFAIVGGALLGMLVFLLAFRPLRNATRITLLVASIGADLILRNGIAMIWGTGLRGYAAENLGSINLGGLAISRVGIIIAAIALFSMAVLWVVVNHTRVGRDMRALADLPELARVVGISPNRVHIWSWAMVGVIAAIAGVCIAWESSLSPDLGWHAVLAAFAAAILGGMGDIRGAVVGGFIMGVASEVATMVMPSTYKPVLAFVVMTLVLLIRPWGIFGKAQRV